MTRVVVLDSGPLGLLMHRPGVRAADECRQWLRTRLSAGAAVVVPEIVDFELRRELLRLGNQSAVARLDAFNAVRPGRFLPLTTAAMRRAAELWAQTRRAGKPTADPHALDIDVILAAQVLTSRIPGTDVVVATSNLAHLALLVPAQEWQTI